MSGHLIDLVREIWSSAVEVIDTTWAEDSAFVTHHPQGDLLDGGGNIVVTPSEDHERGVYLFCVYDGDDWYTLGDPSASVHIRGAANVVTLIGDLTYPTMQPEGTDWAAWATLRLADWADDDVIEGLVKEPPRAAGSLLDSASPPEPIAWIPAKARFTVVDDGLSQPWKGRVWMNPPYSKLTPWVDRFMAHGNGIALLPFSNSAWWRKLWCDPSVPMAVIPDSFAFVGGGAFPSRLCSSLKGPPISELSPISVLCATWTLSDPIVPGFGPGVRRACRAACRRPDGVPPEPPAAATPEPHRRRRVHPAQGRRVRRRVFLAWLPGSRSGTAVACGLVVGEDRREPAARRRDRPPARGCGVVGGQVLGARRPGGGRPAGGWSGPASRVSYNRAMHIPSSKSRAACTGVAATWCPVHGDCICHDSDRADVGYNDPSCPLHSVRSTHAELSS